MARTTRFLCLPTASFLSSVFLVILTLTLQIKTVTSNSCTDQCDLTYTGGYEATFCGTDHITHTTHYDAFDNKCYNNCGVMALHEGQCGCPNECFASFGQGQCNGSVGSATCQCAGGWGGSDCSQPRKGNICSLHGAIVQADSKDSAFTFDYCRCDEGWTGIDCSSQELTIGNAPWGGIFADDDEVDSAYTGGDQYQDEHPVWNVSVLASVRISVTEEDYLYLLQPWNLYNESYVSCNVSFDNGNSNQQFLKNVGFRLKGAASRMDQKKGWVLKFNEFESGQKLFDIKKLGFKPGSTSDDTLLKIKLYVDMSRAVQAPAYRGSYALFYVNDQFVGLYFMHEDIAPDYMDGRIHDDSGKGNLMKLYYSVHLNYFGPDPNYYYTKNHTNAMGVDLFYYEQSDGNGEWDDFIKWLNFLNSSSSSVFADEIEDRVDVSSMLRAMTVESFMLATDNYADGGNYYAYHRTSDKHPDQWVIMETDFDECFSFEVGTMDPSDPSFSSDIFGFFFTDYNPLLQRLLNPSVEGGIQTQTYRDQYVGFYETFLESLFGSDSPQQPSARYSAMLQLILPWVAKDRLWQMSYGMTVEDFLQDAEGTIAHLPLRYENTIAQVSHYRAQQ